MDRVSNKILQHLVLQWENVKTSLSRMHAATEVKPHDGYAIFKEEPHQPDGVIAFGLAPVVFRLPERANHVHPSLFVVVQGRLCFDRVSYEAGELLRTLGFSTQAGYFRLNNNLKHVYGAHFDFSRNDLGHPVFHAQMKSFKELARHAIEFYSLENTEPDDCIAGILKSVRLPCAQMDMFSLFLQIFADHLLYQGSGEEEKIAFGELLKKSCFLQGAGFQFERLGTPQARECYRALHWYPI